MSGRQLAERLLAQRPSTGYTSDAVTQHGAR